MAIVFVVDAVVRLVGASDSNSAVCCWAFVFFCGMIFATYPTGWHVFEELCDVSKLVAIATLVVEAGVVVVAEFGYFFEDREVACTETTLGVGAYQ